MFKNDVCLCLSQPKLQKKAVTVDSVSHPKSRKAIKMFKESKKSVPHSFKLYTSKQFSDPFIYMYNFAIILDMLQERNQRWQHTWSRTLSEKSYCGSRKDFLQMLLSVLKSLWMTYYKSEYFILPYVITPTLALWHYFSLYRYLSRYDEELEQIKLKHAIGQRKNRQHASREDVIRHTQQHEREEYNTCGMGL